MSLSYGELLLENARLRSKVAELQSATSAPASSIPPHHRPADSAPLSEPCPSSSPGAVHSLDRHSILRYSRHLLCSELGNRPVVAQSALLHARVLVVGAGGLGCPVLLHLAAAGVGHLGIVDQDVIDLSNLPRQTLYEARHVGQLKAHVAAQRVREINERCTAVAHATTFDPSSALQLCAGYDLVVDCSDNVSTRYLCNDVCVLLGIPCVSGAALRMEGQLTVYGWKDGPCYRCLHPQPPPTHMVTNCNEGGVLNAVTGTIGALQALECIKLIALQRADEEGKGAERKEDEDGQSVAFASSELEVLSGRLLCFDATSTTFRVVNLRPRSPHCAVCSSQRSITVESLHTHNYAAAQPACATDPRNLAVASFNDDAPSFLLSPPSLSSVPPSTLASYLHPSSSSPPSPYLLLDVRPALQFDIAHLPSSLNIPLATLPSRLHSLPPSPTIFIICRRGIDSRHAAALVTQAMPGRTVLNVEGGLVAWTEQVDPAFPLY